MHLPFRDRLPPPHPLSTRASLVAKVVVFKGEFADAKVVVCAERKSEIDLAGLAFPRKVRTGERSTGGTCPFALYYSV